VVVAVKKIRAGSETSALYSFDGGVGAAFSGSKAPPFSFCK